VCLWVPLMYINLFAIEPSPQEVIMGKQASTQTNWWSDLNSNLFLLFVRWLFISGFLPCTFAFGEESA
jgi:hypothetical protein